MLCSIQLGQGTNVFNNMGTFHSGPTVVLGAGNSLINSGILEIGGHGVVATSALTGNFVQTGSGSLHVDLDNKAGTADYLIASGTGEIEGRIVVNPLNHGYIRPGTSQVTIFTGLGGTEAPGLSVASTAVMRYQLLLLNSRDIVLRTSVDFNPSGLTRNQRVIGDFINRLQTAGGAPGQLDSLLAYHISLPDVQSLGRAYYSLLPYTYEADTLSTINVTSQYQRTMQNRMKWLRPSFWTPGNAETALSSQRPILLAFNGPDSQLGQFLRPAEPAAGQQRLGFWLDGFSQFAHSAANDYTGFNICHGRGQRRHRLCLHGPVCGRCGRRFRQHQPELRPQLGPE